MLHHYLPPGLRYATLTGTLADARRLTTGATASQRLERDLAERDLAPLLDRAPGRPAARAGDADLLRPGRWQAPWTSLVRDPLARVGADLLQRPPLRDAAIAPTAFTPPRPNPVRATVLVKVPLPRAG